MRAGAASFGEPKWVVCGAQTLLSSGDDKSNEWMSLKGRKFHCDFIISLE